jgi:hypothetical protein
LAEHIASGAAPHALSAVHALSQTCFGVAFVFGALPLPWTLLLLPHATESPPKVAIHQAIAIRIVVSAFSPVEGRRPSRRWSRPGKGARCFTNTNYRSA